MIDGIYSAASGLRAQQHRLDAISNDLANVNTTGYKTLRFSFSDLLYQKVGDHRAQDPASEHGKGATGGVIGRDFTQGATNRTDQPYDLAISGPGFFRVRDQDGRELLTRDGAFRPDAQGRLTTSAGHRLIPEVRIPGDIDASRVSIGADGTVTAPGGQRLGRVIVVDVPVREQLLSVGENLYAPTAQSGVAAATAARVQQGALESSNVDVAEAFSDMIQTQRAFDMTSRSIRTWDELLQSATSIRR